MNNKMEAKDLNITLDTHGEKEAVLRIGEAAPIVMPKKVNLQTSVSGPREYFEKIAKTRQPAETPIEGVAVVTVSDDNLSITLSANPEDEYAPIVKGKLVPNPELNDFQINKKNGKFTAKQLAEMLRENFHNLVTDKATFRDFTQKILNLNYKVTKEVEASDDERGNVVDNFVQKLTVDDIPKSIKFNAPIYLGEKSVEFEAQLGVEAGNGSILFYLFSTDLGLMQRQMAEEIMAKEIKFFQSQNVCTLYSV